jgi:hypothetical protein
MTSTAANIPGPSTGAVTEQHPGGVDVGNGPGVDNRGDGKS